MEPTDGTAPSVLDRLRLMRAWTYSNGSLVTRVEQGKLKVKPKKPEPKEVGGWMTWLLFLVSAPLAWLAGPALIAVYIWWLVRLLG